MPQQDLISQQQQQGRSWRHRLRHLLCCVAPPPSQHQQQAAQFGACSAADLQLVNTLYSLPPQVRVCVFVCMLCVCVEVGGEGECGCSPGVCCWWRLSLFFWEGGAF